MKGDNRLPFYNNITMHWGKSSFILVRASSTTTAVKGESLWSESASGELARSLVLPWALDSQVKMIEESDLRIIDELSVDSEG